MSTIKEKKHNFFLVVGGGWGIEKGGQENSNSEGVHFFVTFLKTKLIF